MAEQVDLPSIQRGDTIPYVFNWSDGVSPIDMQSKTIIMSFKLDAVIADDDASLIKTIVIDAVDVDASNGIVSFQLEGSETGSLLPNATYAYSVRVIETAVPEDIETTFFYGNILVEDS